jgi:hypothetical protein
MLTKIRRQDCLEKYQNFPLRCYNEEKDEVESSSPKTYKSYILTLPSKSFKGHIKLLGSELTNLTERLSSNTLLFLGDTELPWLNQDNEYKPAKEAREYFISHKVGKRFNGGLRVGIAELPIFTKHLCWLTRCNAALPYFHFIDEDQNILGQICQYENLHLYLLNPNMSKQIERLLENSKFILSNENCSN